jgi:hypothetical protein
VSGFSIKRATRQGIKPLIVLYSESGCGKSYGSLLLARGFVGPSGRIILGDSESGRGSLYADVLPGGYDVIDIEPPFTPQRHVEFIDYVEKAGAQIGILDSGSHEWEGVGGVLDMAADIESKKGKGLHCWAGPKVRTCDVRSKAHAVLDSMDCVPALEIQNSAGKERE